MSLTKLSKEIKKWSKQYELSFQFWPRQNNVWIYKDQVEIFNRGGLETMEEAMQEACDFLNRINSK